MKHILSIAIFATSLIGNAQDFKTEFRKDLCDCFTESGDDEMGIDECFELNTTKYDEAFEKLIDPESDVSPYEQGIAIGQDLFYESQDYLVANCDAYYKYFNALREESFLEMKDAFDQNILSNLTIEISEEPSADLLWSRGNMYFAIESYDRALEDFENAIALDPSYAQANFSKGWIFERQGKYTEAIQLYEEALEETGIREMKVFIALAKRNAKESKK
ncbi:hypothetical protein ULMA_11600 [Patiriisocius marinus]|uniref:Uncharacterized protein n=1 Tax=Patiriisocius marinus TaxID=1397112 RepID=A0A5J4IXG5_9FLAO|nr:tetratricopeptide repeat protein [Patiriisocius marinus]GER59052.1 hypothetical protein ULMA_11600 [Patiriisocius marinus]